MLSGKEFFQMRMAWLGLKRYPGLILSVVSTLGVTLGALLCVLTLGYLLLLQPLPYPEQDSLYKIEHQFVNNKNTGDMRYFTYPGAVSVYQQPTLFDSKALLSYGENILASIASEPRVNTTFVTPEWFSLTAMSMYLGRGFSVEEGLEHYQPVAVISYHLWQQQFAGRQDILGQSVEINDIQFKIIGVNNQDYVEPQLYQKGRDTDIWLPFDYNGYDNFKQRWGNFIRSLVLVGKLKPGVTYQQAGQQLTAQLNPMWQSQVAGISVFNGWSIDLHLQSLQQVLLGNSKRNVYLLLAAVMGLVLIACGNIINLFMSFSASQQHNLVIQTALGANKKHLFGYFLGQSILIMLMVMALALLVSWLGFMVMQTYFAGLLPRVSELHLSWMTLCCTLILLCLFSYLFAWASYRSIRINALATQLHGGGKGVASQVSPRTRKALIISQISLTSVLIFANLTLLYTAVAQINRPDDLHIQNVEALSISAVHQTDVEMQQDNQDVAQIRQQLLALPQVEQVSQSHSPLKKFSVWSINKVGDTQIFTPHSALIDENYLPMFAQQLVAGRNFTRKDVQQQALAVIINQTLARQLLPDGDVLGTQITFGGPRTMRIIGVVKGMQMPGEEHIPPRIYAPSYANFNQLMLRLKPGQFLSQEQLSQAIKQASSRYALFEFTPLSAQRKSLLLGTYTTAITTAVVIVLGLILAAIGLYGVLSSSTASRRFEIGTRMALGAKNKAIVSLIIRENSAAIISGLLLAGAVIVSLLLMFYPQLEPYMGMHLWGLYSLNILLMLSLAMFACYWPLRRFLQQAIVLSLKNSE
ncbi:ABC transporter permease [Neptunicella marina]|uniref:ABC transporter permease n=1 Tax=Neptunicella marina TaxID=2125989 RepID=A0A8J6ISY1_9ALTE|nr:ABC transporter permease [Neptunicella marina]MBC3765719.1 ABC transporter permease [Neptunicella marina]